MISTDIQLGEEEGRLSGSGRPDPRHINSLRLILNAKTITIILVKLTIQVQKGSWR